MSDHQDQPSSQGQPSGYQEVRQAGRADEKGQRGKGKARGEEPKPPPTYTHRTAAHWATTGRQQGPPWSHTGPPERGCVLAPAQQQAPARSVRHTQATQGTHAARHASTHHRTKNNTTMTNTHARRQGSRQEQVQAQQSPQRNSRRLAGRVCARQCTHPLPATKQPPSGRTCVRPAVYPAPAGYKTAAVLTDVCAPGSEPSPSGLRNSSRPDGRVCTRQ